MQETEPGSLADVPDPDEVEEEQLVNGMAWAVLAAIALAILALTLWPWVKARRAGETA
ncbi:MAG: hypothetical protein ACK2UK_19180 [Candidatus Promineifilaceae bacterium]|jgi:hypothetical protein